MTLAAAVEDSPSPSASPKTGAASLTSWRLTVTVIVSSAESPSPSEAVRTTTHSLSPPQISAS